MLLDGPAAVAKRQSRRRQADSDADGEQDEGVVSTSATVVSINTGSNDATCAAAQGRPMDLISASVQSYASGGQGQFGMHDHVYVAPGVPDPHRAFVLYTYSARVIVSGVTVIDHVNGVATLEGFAGDSPDSMQSVGVSFGARGMGHASSELASNSYVFPYPRAGKYFKVIIRSTPLANGYAFCTCD